ncbi:hypothetical protein PENSPDRAFT_695631 [Peniophora sp. CONT]|nr:hypothetical protein PENSPDRAFT_695631 [Peniophora sp. CONT]
MSGIHFYNHTQLLRSLCGWICANFATWNISNAEHDNFLSLIQAFGTYYAAGFVPKERKELYAGHHILRTLPDPSREHGVPCIAAITASLVFHDTWSCAEKPVKGLYYKTDRWNMKKSIGNIAKEGYIEVTETNMGIVDGYHYEIFSYCEDHNVDMGAFDDRWTCAGIGPIMVHVGRATVNLAWRWQDDQKRLAQEDQDMYQGSDDEEEPTERMLEKAKWQQPQKVYERAVQDLSNALGLPKELAEKVMGPVESLRTLKLSKKLFPKMKWVSEKPRKSKRPPSLWDAFYTRPQPQLDEMDLDEGDLADGEPDRMDEDKDEDYTESKRSKSTQRLPKSKARRNKDA